MSSYDNGTYRGSAPFRWTEETGVINLGALHEEIFSFGSGTSISGDGSVVGGFSENEDGIHEAFLWTEETGLMSLQDFLAEEGHDVSEWELLTDVSSISLDGSFITGSGVNLNGETEAFVARLNLNAVPEPGSAVIILGLFSIAAMRRNRLV